MAIFIDPYLFLLMLIPVQRKFEKRTVSHPSRVAKTVGGVVRRIPLAFVWVFFWMFALIYGVFLLLKYTLFVPEYVIKKVDYSLSSVQQYDNPYLYKQISTLIKWENYYVVHWNNWKILSQVQVVFPFVTDVIITYKSSNKVFVKVLFDQPQLVMRSEGLKFWVYQDHVFQIFSGNTLGSGTMGMDVLSFTSWLQFLTGIFYQQSAENLIENLFLLKQWFPKIQGFVYLPGGQRTIVVLPGDKKVYINNVLDIQQQIKNYQLLQKYYPDFNTLKEIDLGSLESDKVIVNK